MDQTLLRPEYEARHSSLQERITRSETYAAERFKELEIKIDDLGKDLTSMSRSIANARVSRWELVAITMMNICFDGGLIGFLALFGHIH